MSTKLLRIASSSKAPPKYDRNNATAWKKKKVQLSTTTRHKDRFLNQDK